MTENLEQKSIVDICVKVSSGGTPSRKNDDYYSKDKSGHLWVKSKELLEKGISITEERITDEGLQNSSAKYYPKGTVLLAMYGANIGQLAWLEEPATVNQAICAMVIDFKKANNKYVYYALLETREKLKVQAQGAAQQNLNSGQIKAFKIPYPPLPTQEKIAFILSTYDDLIENNNRRIAILEEMAQKLYREWFVKFRFPGHEDVKMVDSELGGIPGGWEVKRLDDICNLTMGQSPRSEFYNDNKEGVPFYQGVADYGLRFPKERIYCTQPTRFAQRGDILFSVRAPVGRLNIANKDLSIGRGLSAINSKQGYEAFLYQQLKYLFRVEDLMGNGAIFNSVTKSDMQNIKLINPKEQLIKEFEKIVVPIFKQLDNLVMRNQNLTQQRDLLLPKLISGKINEK